MRQCAAVREQCAAVRKQCACAKVTHQCKAMAALRPECCLRVYLLV